MAEDKLAFWNDRGALNENSGTNDYHLKWLELNQILLTIPDYSRVLDVGCGGGETLVSLAKLRTCTGTGVDFAENMVAQAIQRAKDNEVDGRVDFRLGSLLTLDLESQYDYVLTERSLMNLANVAEQRAAFERLMKCVKVGGYYLMVESCIDGLNRTNQLRELLGLSKIDPPWHNCFLSEAELDSWQDNSRRLVEAVPFSSTYYYLSRVVYAKVAAEANEEPQYDSPINRVSVQLPAIGDFGPVKMWKWQRLR